MVNPVHEFTKTDSRRRVSTPMIHEQRDNRDARKKFAISSVARRQALNGLAFLLFCLTPLAAQEVTHSDIAVDAKTEDLTAQPVAANWLSYNGDYTGQGLRGADQI